ncbi:hypothetical protein FBY04_12878 [Pseudomonas sp. SJZ080]|uniref:hypothetical protein n=1 Tax=Pseudomonas sp. SJZ080 TaxID=2572888 RepID=UPI00119BB3F4|nr:hypothetical protein [Pseudomonas sp. SJZ080]TWC47300.1 hypothetical protein FBY04_12878 [Pseudomonas sp. SJZ080]
MTDFLDTPEGPDWLHDAINALICGDNVTAPRAHGKSVALDQVDTTDPSATKNFTGMGGFKGTAIKPTYLMRKATEVFGPCGEGWGWTVLEDRFDEGGPLQAPTKEWPEAPRINAKLHTLKIELWYLGKDGQKCTVQHYGHTPFVLLQQGKIITDWEAAKKSLTDAIGKCLQGQRRGMDSLSGDAGTSSSHQSVP